MTPALRSAAVIVSVVLAGISSGAAAGASAPNAVTRTVAIDGTRFQPGMLTIRLGDTIVWVNKDPFPHTVTSKAGGFDSGAIQPDKSWRFKPTTRGDFDYICTFHTTMRGRLDVR